MATHGRTAALRQLPERPDVIAPDVGATTPPWPGDGEAEVWPDPAGGADHMTDVRRRILVEGHVQGVFFRASCRRQAVALEVAGSARNLADGRVEVVAEGAAAAVAQLVAWCRQGPPGAHVAHVEVLEEPPVGLHGFTTS